MQNIPNKQIEEKEYEKWFKLKPKINSTDAILPAFPREGDIWWCSLGVNIGIEIDGRNELFERPVLVIRVFGKEHILIAPIRSKDGVNPSFSISISYKEKTSYILLSQIRTVSVKRFQYYVYTVSPEIFKESVNKIKNFL